MKLTEDEIKDYERQGFKVERVEDVIKKMEAIPKEKLLPSQELCLLMLHHEDPKEYSLSKVIPFSKKRPYHFTNRYIKYCPNDRTKLPRSEVTGIGLNGKYTEYTRCPKCSCLIKRKPSDEAIKEYEGRPPILIRSDISQLVGQFYYNQ